MQEDSQYKLKSRRGKVRAYMHALPGKDLENGQIDNA